MTPQDHQQDQVCGPLMMGEAQDARHDETFGTLADVAQLVEQLPCKQQVSGSSPDVSSRK